MQLILASQSIGRKKLLEQSKIPFLVIPSTLDEDKIVTKTPLGTLKLRAKLKGEEVALKITQSANNPITQFKKTRPYTLYPKPYLILSADSGVILNNQLIGKPKDYEDAVRILKTLSGKTHQFVTAVYIIKMSQKKKKLPSLSKTRCNLGIRAWGGHSKSWVTFRKLSDNNIKRYLSTINYTKYAGGYAIASAQDFITEIIGSISNVIGLPLEKVIPILQKNRLL